MQISVINITQFAAFNRGTMHPGTYNMTISLRTKISLQVNWERGLLSVTVGEFPIGMGGRIAINPLLEMYSPDSDFCSLTVYSIDQNKKICK